MTSGTAEAEKTEFSSVPEPDLRQGELRRIVGSETFSKSPRLAALLTHICERTWSGQVNELSEQQIGIYFFHRSPGFNTGEDAIVRGSARHLRKRLDLYYEAEGRGNPERITVPKGGYVARFETHAPAHADPLPLPEVRGLPTPVPARQQIRPTRLIWVMLALLLAGVAAALLWRHAHTPLTESSDGPPLLWKTLFQPNRRTVLVPGDPSLNLYTAYVHHPVRLREYTEQQYQHDPAIAAVSPEGPGMLTMVDTVTMADMELVSELVRVPYREGIPIPDRNVEVRFARDVNDGDLRGANLVLLGSSTFDPWVTVFDKDLDFQLDRGFEHYTFRVLNRAPKGGEASVYTKSDNEVLTILALTETPSSNEHVLLIGGSRMGAVYAAEHFLFTQRMWQPIIEAATKNGKLQNFEVLMKSDFVKDEVSNTQVLTYHVH